MTDSSVRILMLEGDPADEELVRGVLEREGLGGDVAVARSLREFRAMLGEGGFEAVLSDYRLPHGTGLEALREARAVDKELPVIIVSGTLGEEQAIEMLKLGATDYVLKSRLSRLGPALRRALAEREQRRLRRRAEELRDRFYALSIDLFAITDRGFSIEDVNSAWERSLGWTRDELVGRDLRELMHEEDRAAAEEALAASVGPESSRRADVRVRARDGRWRWIQWTASYDADDQRVYSVGRDITLLKRAHDELADRARHQELLVELGRNALREVDLDSLFARGVRVVAEGCRTEYAVVLELSPDGKWLDVRAYHGARIEGLTPPRIAVGRESQAGYTLECGGPVVVRSWAEETRFRPAPISAEAGVVGGSTVVIPGRKRPFGVLGVYSREPREYGAETSSFLQTVANVLAEAVERRRYEDELRSTEEQLRHAQRMEALGMLAAGVAHDFNNVLTAILGYTELASEDEVDAVHRKQYLAEVRAAADRAVGLSSQLLTFSRSQVRAPRVFDLSTVPRELERMLRRVIGEDVDLRLDLATIPLYVEADPTQVEQIVLNLAVNARDAMPRGGSILIETRAAAPDPASLVSGDVERGRSYQRLSIVDTGSGMDEETRRRLFEPFFTTKPEGRGTGLGLPIVEKIVRQNRGAIGLVTAPGRGTRFDVFLPQATALPPPVTGEAELDTRAGRGESVLVLDDDVALRRIVAQVLAKNGYLVTEAADVEEARNLAQLRTQPFDLLLSDLVLERGSGPELSVSLVAAGKIRRTLLMSGFMSHPIAERWLIEPGEKFLPKPFSQDQLLRAVRDALDR